MYVSDDIIAYLGSNEGVAAVITTTPLHIFASAVPLTAGKLSTSVPYILVEVEGGDNVRDMTGPTGTCEPIVTIRVVAERMSKAMEVFAAVDAALEVQGVQMGDMWVQQCFVGLPEDTSTTRTDGSEALTTELSTSLDMIVTF